jgi:hypothetical protein
VERTVIVDTIAAVVTGVDAVYDCNVTETVFVEAVIAEMTLVIVGS